MSDPTLQYFFYFEIEPSNSFLKIASLKRGVMASTFLFILIEFIFFIVDIFHSEESIIVIILRHGIFSFLNFLSFVLFTKSTFQFDYKQSYYAYLFFTLGIVLHTLLFIINIIFGTHLTAIYFASKDDYESTSLPYNFYSYSLPNLIFLALELIASWFFYSYVKNLSYGKDALVDGQSFDKYNMGLSESKERMPKNTQSSSKKDYGLQQRKSEIGIFELGLNYFGNFTNKINESQSGSGSGNNDNNFNDLESMSNNDASKKQEMSLTKNENSFI